MSEDAPIVTSTYPTRGTHKKLMSGAMAASKSKATKKRKLRSTIVVKEEEVPNDKLVNMDTEEENSEIESDEDLGHFRFHTKIT